MGRGSWVVGRGSWVVGRGSWVVGTKTWVVGINYELLTTSIINPCFPDAGRDYITLEFNESRDKKTWRRSTHGGITINLRISVPFTSNKYPLLSAEI